MNFRSFAPRSSRRGLAMTKQTSQLQGERWWIHGPADDETLHSITERAWRCYGAEGHTLRRRVWPRATSLPGEDVGLDGISAREVCVLARAIGVEPRELYRHRLQDHPLVLQENQRRAYCPSCWHEDAKAGHPPSFRRAWMGVFTLDCPVHRRPLHWAPLGVELHSPPTSRMPVWPRTAEGRDLLRTITGFARTLHDCLEGKATWPTAWRGSPDMARALLMRVVVNLGRIPEHPPFASIGFPAELFPFVGVPARRVAPLQMSPWEHVRALGPPAWRRAAFWMVARYVMPAHRRPPRPEGLPMEPFAALDAQWDSPFQVRELQRVQRYRHALRLITRPLVVARKGESRGDDGH
ncbi:MULTISPECIES: TniQ family protein [Dyella]|uniref:TniQ domain-containing protein n=3 Tax=Dyella TaxID=231454 RepID=A0A4R0YUC1_9GAMM|nr:hypothetical protein EYV96_04055 [Dyella terrae]TCI13013.1 hypothetical protein EZM97_06810 [Dyella soli]